jgi:hypothetical protein
MIAWLASSDVFARCDDEHATWESASRDGVRHTLAIRSDDQLVGFIARIEEWRGDKLAWRLQAEILCSNGAVTCRLDVPNTMNPDDANKGEDDYATTIVERIDADGDDNSEWIVLAGLEQELYYSGGASVEFLNGFGREYDDERMLAPNIYKFAGCREASDPPKTGEPGAGHQVAGAVYGIPQLCDVYEHEHTLIPSILGKQPNVDFRFGTWWMDDERVVGGQGDCAIVRKNPNGTIDLSCLGWDQQWEESRKYSEEGNVRHVGDVELKRCKG